VNCLKAKASPPLAALLSSLHGHQSQITFGGGQDQKIAVLKISPLLFESS